MEIRKPISVFALLRIGLLLLCMSGLLSPLKAETSEQELERVKVAFVYKFLSFVEWTGKEQPSSKHDMVIGVVGNKQLKDRFSILSGKYIREREISIKQIRAEHGSPFPVINVLYVAQGHEQDFTNISTRISDHPVLTIAEGNRDQLRSTMIVIYEQDGYLRFAINNTLARSKGLKLNAKLLELAERVI